MKELELELQAVTSEVDKIVEELTHTPKKSTDYNRLLGKLDAYTDVQNMIIWRINALQKEGK